MFSRKTISLIVFAGLVFAVLFEVRLPLDFSGVETIQVRDPDIEAAFRRCYDEQDEEMHRAVFATIDNPDVQKEMIITNRENIALDCRQRFPEKILTVEREVATNLIDLAPRFW